MKKNMNGKLVGLAVTATLSLAMLTACGGGTAAVPGQSAAPSATQSQDPAGAAVGTVLLSVNPEIEMEYDGEGNVVTLSGLNDEGRAVLASYTGYEGRPCKSVVGELVEEINAGGYFDATIDGHEKNIVLKLERGSEYPSDAFLNELADAVRVAVEEGQIGSQAVTLDQVQQQGEALLLPTDSLFAEHPALLLTSAAAEKRVCCGNPITLPGTADGIYRIYSQDRRFLCLSQARDGTLTSIKNFFGA